MNPCPLGFLVRGGKHEPRMIVDFRRAFAGFAACDPAAQTEREHYLSAFTFGEDFRRHHAATGSTRDFEGRCASDRVWWDIDRADDLAGALADARALYLCLTDRWRVPESGILGFFSGSKGFHIGVATALWMPVPSVWFHRIARHLAAGIAGGAGGAGVAYDRGVYAKVQLFRAPNSRHPKTGRRKRLLTGDELMGMSVDRIVELAREPAPFDVPVTTARNELLAAAWTQAEGAVAAEEAALAAHRAQLAADATKARLFSDTLDFIRNGAPTGGAGSPPEAGRHRRLFAAAANLAEFSDPRVLIHALLTEAALDCGLPPGEVRRTIDNAIDRVARKDLTHG